MPCPKCSRPTPPITQNRTIRDHAGRNWHLNCAASILAGWTDAHHSHPAPSYDWPSNARDSDDLPGGERDPLRAHAGRGEHGEIRDRLSGGESSPARRGTGPRDGGDRTIRSKQDQARDPRCLCCHDAVSFADTVHLREASIYSSLLFVAYTFKSRITLLEARF